MMNNSNFIPFYIIADGKKHLIKCENLHLIKKHPEWLEFQSSEYTEGYRLFHQKDKWTCEYDMKVKDYLCMYDVPFQFWKTYAQFEKYYDEAVEKQGYFNHSKKKFEWFKRLLKR